MRTIPGMVVINPSDDVEARAAVKAAYEYQGPDVYKRQYVDFRECQLALVNHSRS